MSKYVLYHGSDHVIDKPTYGIGNPNNDYGLGFYCTADIELAKEWACGEGDKGYANSYEMDAGDLSILNLNGDEYHILNWLAILLENRRFSISAQLAMDGKKYIEKTFMPKYKKSDIMIGYRADDSYFSFARAFLNNTISLQKLQKAMYLGKLGNQIVIKSKKAFGRVIFQDAEPVDIDKYRALREKRDRKARDDYKNVVETGNVVEDVFLIDIMREGWKNDDKRLQKAVSR